MPKIKKCYCCDDCTILIENPDDGFVIKGNIYIASPESHGGLIGNNFPAGKVTGIALGEIGETVLCKSCFLKALKLNADN